jgi:hypothetical protein
LSQLVDEMGKDNLTGMRPLGEFGECFSVVLIHDNNP